MTWSTRLRNDSGIIERRLHFQPTLGKLAPRDQPKADAFIKGPLPLAWMTKAAQLPGKTLQVALALWYLSGVQRTPTVRLAVKTLEKFGVSRDAKYEALERLALLGLIQVQQDRGKAPMVTLLQRLAEAGAATPPATLPATEPVEIVAGV